MSETELRGIGKTSSSLISCVRAFAIPSLWKFRRVAQNLMQVQFKGRNESKNEKERRRQLPPAVANPSLANVEERPSINVQQLFCHHFQFVGKEKQCDTYIPIHDIALKSSRKVISDALAYNPHA